jgi:hypothetical protein
MSVIPTLRRLRQEDHKLEISLGYLVRSCLKKQTNEQTKENNHFGVVVLTISN